MTISFPRTVYRNAAALCAMIFLSDLRFGILAPTFSIYVVSLGGSLAFVGALGSLFSLTRLVSSIPVGLASDLWGRKNVLVGGLILLAGSVGAYGFVRDIQFLILLRVIEGLGHCILYTVGIAALVDSVPPAQRGTAIGVYMMTMGFGNSVGGVLGGMVADAFGFAPVFWMASLALFVGLLLVAVLYRPVDGPAVRMGAAQHKWSTIRRWVFDRNLLPIYLGIFLMSLSYNSAVISFFPLYASSVGVRAAALGAMFGFRNLLSTLIRLPAGIQATPGRRLPLMVKTVALTMTAMLLVPTAADPLRLTVFLCAEGLAFGTFITVGQAHANARSVENRGTVLGIYATFGSLGSTLGSLALGALAQVADISFVFSITGVILMLGLVSMWWIERNMQLGASV